LSVPIIWARRRQARRKAKAIAFARACWRGVVGFGFFGLCVRGGGGWLDSGAVRL
jgi:hypothetical protein